MITNQCVAKNANISASITENVETITTKLMPDIAWLEKELKRNGQKMKDVNSSKKERRATYENSRCGKSICGHCTDYYAA